MDFKVDYKLEGVQGGHHCLRQVLVEPSLR